MADLFPGCGWIYPHDICQSIQHRSGPRTEECHGVVVLEKGRVGCSPLNETPLYVRAADDPRGPVSPEEPGKERVRAATVLLRTVTLQVLVLLPGDVVSVLIQRGFLIGPVVLDEMVVPCIHALG